MADRKLSVTITADAKKAQKALGDFERSASKHGKGTEKALDGVKGRLLDLGVAGAGLFAFNEFNEAEKVAKQTEAALKSTGGAAKVSADQVGQLSESLSEKAAVDDELIQSGANLLLTFTKVRNEVGEGNDIFNQATETALDLSVALGTDMQSASMLLGKALNDPLKGLTALSRAGVQFTADQKEQIKTLVATGDTLGAQKIILEELRTQVEGSAAAQATSYDRAKVAAGNLAETVGGLLAPAVETAASAGARAASEFQDLDRWQQQLAVGLAAGGYAWMRWGEQAADAFDNVRGKKGAAGAASTFDKVNEGLGVAGLALGTLAASYNVTYKALEKIFDSGDDAEAFATALEGIGSGTSTLGEAAEALNTDTAGLVKSFDTATGAADSFAEGLGYLFTAQDGLGSSTMKDALADVEAFDKGMADLVNSGNLKGAEEAYGALVPLLREQGMGYDEIAELLPSYNAALDEAEKKNGITGEAVGVMTDALTEQGEAAETFGVKAGAAYERIQNRADAAEQAIRDFHSEQIGQLSGQIEVLDALQQYGETLYANGLQTDINTQKGRDNQSALIDYAEAAKQAAADEYERTGSMEAARQKMEEYRLRLIDTQTQAGYTKDEIAFMVEEMGFNEVGIFNMDASGALAAIDEVQRRIDALSLGSVMAGLAGPYGGSPGGGNAQGGHTSAMGVRGVNESGQEWFRPNNGGTIIPVGPTRNNLAAGGGTTIYLSVPGAGDPNAVADAVVRKINAAQRATGRTPINISRSALV